MKIKILFSILFVITGIGGLRSQTLIGYDKNPDVSALLELGNQSGALSTKGVLFPRVNDLDTTQFNLNGGSGTEGMVVYNTTANTKNNGKGLYYWNGSRWIYMKRGGTSNEWLLDGNTNGVIKTLGTKDNNELPFITNSSEKMRITVSGNVGIGTTAPKNKFSVQGGAISQEDFANGDKLLMMGYTKSPKITTDSGWILGSYAGSLVGLDGTAPQNANTGQFTWNVGDVSNTWREVMRLDNAGDLGVGTASPSSKLDVAGNTILDGQVTLLNVPTSLPEENLLTLDGAGNVKKSVNVILNRTTQIKTFAVPSIATGTTASTTITSNTDNYFITVIASVNGCGRTGIARFMVGQRKVISFLGGQSRNTVYTATSLDANGSKLRLHAIMTSCQAGGGDHQFDFDIEIVSGNVINITNTNGTLLQAYTIIVEEC